MMEGLSLVGAVLTLAAVLGLAYWCSRFLGGKWIRVSGKGKVQILEQIPLGPDKRLLLIRYENREYLVGVTQTGMTVISCKDVDEEEVSAGTDQSFSNILKTRIMGKGKKGDER